MLGCVAGAPAPTPAVSEAPPGVRASAPAPRVVVAPLNLAVARPDGLEDALLPVETQLLRSLEARGTRPVVLHPGDAWMLWRSAVASIAPDGPPPQRLAAAVRAFAAGLSESGARFDRLLLPALAIRTARMTGGVAAWDGVERRLRVEVRNAASAAAYAPAWREVPALSIHVSVFDPAGRLEHEGWGGLDLVYAAVIDADAHDGRPALVLRRDMLQAPAEVREGIAVALEGLRPARRPAGPAPDGPP
jgi:hypothetical protein